MATHIDDATDPRIADYAGVRDPELLRRRGLFVAENRLVVRELLASPRFRTRSLLLTEAAYAALRDMLESPTERAATGGRPCTPDVYVCPKALMEPISGYHIHRGCLALGVRPAPVSVDMLLATLPDARGVVVMEAMTNADNVGAIFRNARAFGADAVVVGPRCCDPLYRKSIRVSIGTVLVVPFALCDPASAGSGSAGFNDALAALRGAGFTLVALTPAPDAIDLDQFAARPLPDRIALVVGNEGEGLSRETLAGCDLRVRIAMAPGVDSLNASTAAGITLHRIFAGRY